MIVNRTLRIYDGCLIDGIIWGYSNYLKAIVAIDSETYTIVKIVDIVECRETLYKKVVEYDGKLYIFPTYGEKIIRYCIDNGEITLSALDKYHMISVADIARKDNWIYVIPMRLDTPFFEMDLQSEKKKIVNEWNSSVSNLLCDKKFFSTTSYLYRNIIFSPCTYTNMVVLYDIRQQTMESISLEIGDDTIFSLTGNQEILYLSGNEKDKIYVWNIKSMELQEIVISDNNTNHALYYRMCVNDRSLFLFPYKNDVIKKINLNDTNEISEYAIPILNHRLRSTLLYGMIRTEKKIILLPLVMDSFFVFDLEKNIWQQFSVQAIEEEINKLFFQIIKFEMESERYNLKRFMVDILSDENRVKTSNIDAGLKSVGENIYSTSMMEQS